MANLEGKVALITGGARGQGRSHAVTLAAAGAKVAICDVARQLETVPYPLATPDDLEETTRLVEKEGGECLALVADVRDASAMADFVERTVDTFGGVDILCANAGIFDAGTYLWEFTEAQWNEVIGVNLTGVWQSCRAVIPQMIDQGRGGSIVLTSSTTGLAGFTQCGHYAAAKHGVVGIMRSLAIELAAHNIRVNTVHPTGVNSPMMENDWAVELFESHPEFAAAGANLLPTAPYVEAIDVSHAIRWLVSDEARYVTGITLPIDAGFLAK